jgi:hypothetical protein
MVRCWRRRRPWREERKREKVKVKVEVKVRGRRIVKGGGRMRKS